MGSNSHRSRKRKRKDSRDDYGKILKKLKKIKQKIKDKKRRQRDSSASSQESNSSNSSNSSYQNSSSDRSYRRKSYSRGRSSSSCYSDESVRSVSPLSPKHKSDLRPRGTSRNKDGDSRGATRRSSSPNNRATEHYPRGATPRPSDSDRHKDERHPRDEPSEKDVGKRHPSKTIDKPVNNQSLRGASPPKITTGDNDQSNSVMDQLGGDPFIEKSCSDPVNPILANLWSKILQVGLNKDQRKLLTGKYRQQKTAT